MDLADLAKGESLGHYKIEKVLGQGAMGVVFLAREETLNRNVAIKVLSPELCELPGFVERFHREAEAVAKLRHPNILQIYTIGEDKGFHYFAMEFVEGQSVAEALRLKGKMKPEEAMDIMEQVAKGLLCAHEAGVIHRDIKPSNIMLDRTGRATITDFGIAKMGQDQVHSASQSSGSQTGPLATGRLTMAGEVVGTPDYMAPEQAMGKEITEAADLYALGVMAYELMTGDLPFHARGLSELLNAKLKSIPPPIGSTSPTELEKRVDALIRKAIHPDPLKRYPTSRNLLKALSGVKEQMTLAEEMKKRRELTMQLTASALSKETRRSTRIPPFALKVLASLICGGVLMGFLVWMWKETSKADPLQKGGAAVVLSSADLGEVRTFTGMVAAIEEYDDGIWLRVSHKGGAPWVLVSAEAYDEAQADVGATVEVKGTVIQDPETQGYMLDASSSGGMTLMNVRTPEAEEEQAWARGPVQLGSLANRANGSWVMVQGKITLLDEMKEPYGLWLEIEDGEAAAGLWIPSPIARRMPANVGGGDVVAAVGRVCHEEPPLSGRLDITAADQIEVVAE